MVLSNKSIGAKIAEARKKKNLSQAELAEKVFISAQTVGKWERGESLPDIVMLTRIAEIFEVDLNYFLDKTSPSIENVTAKLDEPSVENKKRWDMSRGEWQDADFSGLANLTESLRASNIQNCQFVGSDLSGIHFKRNDISGCDFSQSKLDNCKIELCDFSKNTLTGASLKFAQFIGSDIQRCDFSQVDFGHAQFKGCDIPYATFTGAVWKNTQFEGCDITNTTFSGHFEDCSFVNCDLAKFIFENATLLSCFFKGVNLRRVKFENCQVDRLTHAFLKNGKANLENVILVEG